MMREAQATISPLENGARGPAMTAREIGMREAHAITFVREIVVGEVHDTLGRVLGLD